MPELVMPRLSDSMEEGVVLNWLKSEGESVEIGEELVEIETDKANMTYESDLAGTLVKVIASEGDTIPVGGRIAIVGDPSEAESAEPAEPVEEAEEAEEAQPVKSVDSSEGAGARNGDSAPKEDGSSGVELATAPSGEDGERVKASPLARRIARERGIELASLEGSGPGGRIIRDDVESAVKRGAEAEPAAATAESATAPTSAKGEVETVEPTRLQQTISRRMSESKATAPHFYLTTEVDMSACVSSRKRLKDRAAEDAVVPSFNDMVVKACAIALGEHPKANGSYRDGRFELYSRVNVGVAVAGEGILVVPTIFDADTKGLTRIATESRQLAGKVRDGSITPPELSGATFSVSNLGMYGITEFDAVINTPQAAILAIGAIVERPVVREGEIVPGNVMSMTLSCDHRILYGAEGAEFLARVRELLEEPLSLAL